MIRKVSVVMCTCNGESYIGEQLDSILHQTYPIYEIVVQDDVSTDSTYSILNEYAERFPIVKVYRNAIRTGVNNNFFSAIKRAGERLGRDGFIALSDQDDIWEKDKIERQMEAVGNHLLCGCRTTPFAQDGAEVYRDTRTPNYSLLRILYTGCLPGHTLLFPVRFLSLVPDVGQIAEIKLYDSILTMTAASYDDIVFVDKVLVKQRRHTSAVTYSAPINNDKTLKNILKTGRYCWRLYWSHRPQLRGYAAVAYQFLSQIHSNALIHKEALYMLELLSKKSLTSLLRLSFFCYKHQTELFYVREKKSFATSLRALTFPIFCSIYFREWKSWRN